MSNKKGKEITKWILAVLAAVLFLAVAVIAGWIYGKGGVSINSQAKSIKMVEKKLSLNCTNDMIQTNIEQVVSIANAKDKLIVIDPGHQGKGNSDKEPVAPGSSTMKAKVSSGTQGRTSGVPEYVVVLDVAFLLRDELEARGYEVIMTRETHDIDISNSERAQIANENEADAFVRLHCNGSENTSDNGAMTICMTPSNPYNGELYEDSYLLSDEILTHLCEATGAKREKIWETDTMSGINWAKVPVTIVEMGYMTNKEEDLKLVDSEYQKILAISIADGIEAYLKTKE